MYNILVCDDDKEIVEAIEIYLTQEGYRILKAYDGTEALEMLEREEVHLLLLDVMMPKLDGIRATLKIREKNSIPIIILSAKSEDADKILGLNVGADDYVTKPFSPLELVARVKSQLRRYTQLGGTAQNENDKIYSVGGLRINDDLKEVTVDAGSLFYAVCSESKFFRDSGCIFIWSVYVYLLFRGLYESYPQNESEEFVEWKSALYDSFFLQKNSRFE